MKTYRWEILVCLLLLAGTWAALSPCLDNDFVNWDDPVYVINNLQLHQGWSLEGVIWAFTETRIQGHWHPLTWISLAIDYDLWGPDPWGFHLTNLLLHLANVLLLFLMLRRLTGAIWRSTVVAGLFAVHPLHVESVAWITERKDVLSTFFWLLTMHAYVFFLTKPQRDRYLLVLLSFAAALLSKPMVVTLPCVLLLLDYWPLKRWGWSEPEAAAAWGGPASVRRLLLEKAPLFALVALSSVMTVVGMARGAVLKTFEGFGYGDLLAHRVVMYVTYLRKMLWPTDLATFYPMPAEPWPLGTVLLAAGLLAAITALSVWQARVRPYLLIGWLWYLGTLFPVNGLVQVASYAMADRYTYIPLVGIFIALVWGLSDLLPHRWQVPVLAPICVGVLVASGLASREQVKVWENSLTLWRHALEVNERNYMAHVQLGFVMRESGRLDEALVYFTKAVEINPSEPRLNYHLGSFLVQQKEYAAARPYLERAAAASGPLAVARPQEAVKIHIALAQTFRQLGLPQDAQRHEDEAERLTILQLQK